MLKITQVSDDRVALAVHTINPGSGLGYTFCFIFSKRSHVGQAGFILAM